MAKAKTKTKTVPAKQIQKKAHVITWVVFLALILGLVGGFMIAKAKYMHKIDLISVMFSKRETERNQIKSKMGKMNKVMKQSGEVWIMKDGNVMILEKEFTLSDGTKVMPSGRYMKPEQNDIMILQDGEGLDMNGNLITEETVEF